MRIFNKVLTTSLLVLWDIVSVAAAIIIGLGLRYGFFNKELNFSWYLLHLQLIILFSIIVVLCNVVCRCYLNVWRHAGITEYSRQVTAAVLSVFLLAIINYIYKFLNFEDIIIISMLELILTLMSRVSVRVGYWAHSRVKSIKVRKKMKRVLVFGASEAGTNLVYKLRSHPEDNLLPVCFIDDNENMWGKKVSGIPVIGGRKKLTVAIRENNISEVIITAHNANHETLKELLTCCHRMHCTLKRFGTIDEVNEKSFGSATISDINLEDLLKRDSVTLNMVVVKSFIENKTILVTGGAGSIGSEICRQVLSFGAKRLLIFDIFENGLYEIENDLKERFDSDRFELILGSIRDENRLEEIFEKYKPDVVFHAAAHKHVPMMELNPKEAIKNNVYGTLNLARQALLHKTEKFILISTDKAVNPTSIMGASKRIAEMIIQMMDKLGETDFAAVRFGNVLGSSGSIVPLFKKQIERGGPLTVTHPEMSRFFMTIPEAVQLVLEAGAMADGGEIFVLDMGEPVLIYDLACDMIRLSGYEPDKDIRIEFIGLRPGEKLFEEISLAEEDVTKTRNNKIYICRPVTYEEKYLNDLLELMNEAVKNVNTEMVFKYVRELVPTFKTLSPLKEANSADIM